MKILIAALFLMSCGGFDSYDFKYCVDRRYKDINGYQISYCHEYKTDRERVMHFYERK